MDKTIFKPYDIRGEYPTQINERTVRRIAEALGKAFSKGKIIMGRDGRTSSPALVFAAKRGLAAARPRRDVVDIGIATTPMFSFFVHSLKASGGIMVTASHNPKGMNGLKIVGKEAAPIGGREVLSLVNKFHGAK